MAMDKALSRAVIQQPITQIAPSVVEKDVFRRFLLELDILIPKADTNFLREKTRRIRED
jgi:hypothetical protein